MTERAPGREGERPAAPRAAKDEAPRASRPGALDGPTLRRPQSFSRTAAMKFAGRGRGRCT